MPIRPKHAPSDARPTAQRQFTDRDDFIATFRTALAAKQPDKHQVLVFYGVGGIGKTSLRKELTRLLESDPGVVTAAVDFDVPGHRDEDTALFALRKVLRDRHKVQFPTFDIAYAVYWQKTRPQTPMTRDNFPLLESGTVLSDALDVLGNLTVVGTIPKLAGMALRGSQAVRNWWAKRGSTELRDLPQFETPQIAERLPMFWASDLKDSLAARGSKAVLFLDTYEALTETERSEGKLYQRDEWVRELVAQLPEVLWVVCGREMLRWIELDSDWNDSLSQHLLGGLSDEDTRRFLNTCGIEDRAIADKIVQGSTGLPYYMDLAVDTYLEAKRRGARPMPADFAHAPAEVFARFLRHLTQPEIETLKVLAVPRFWDRELFESLVTRFSTGYPLTAFADLCRFSFIDEVPAADNWTMHKLMRESLREHTDAGLAERVHKCLFDHYAAKLKGIDVKDVTHARRVALREGFYHGRESMGAEGLFNWLIEASAVFTRAAQWAVQLPLLSEAVDRLEKGLGPDHLKVADGLNRLAALHYYEGHYAEAEPRYRRALAIREAKLGPDGLEVASSLNDLAVLLHYRGMRTEAESLYRRALAIKESELGPDHADVAVSMNNLASLLADRGAYDEAETLFRRALAIAEGKMDQGQFEVAESLNNLAVLLHGRGRSAEAESLFRRALVIMESTLGPDHPDVANSLNNLAALLHQSGRDAEAEPLFRRSLTIRESMLGPEHPDVANSLSNLAALLRHGGRYAEAEPMFRRALAIEEHTLGPDHLDVAKTLKGLSELCERTGRIDEARQLSARMKLIREKSRSG